MRPAAFIGSSTESLPIAEAIQTLLELVVESTIWSQGVFGLSDSPMNSLLAAAGKVDFAIFVLAADDITKMRGSESRTIRDNVIFELGLFTGQLGIQRCFMVVPRDAADLHLPSDLLGLTAATYDTGRADGNLLAALGPACARVKSAVLFRGPLLRPHFVHTEDATSYRGPNIEGRWFSFDSASSEPSEIERVGTADIRQQGHAVRMTINRTKSRAGKPISRVFEYSGNIDSGQLTLLFDDVTMRGFITGAIVLKLAGNNRSLAGKTVYLDRDTGRVVSHDMVLVREP